MRFVNGIVIALMLFIISSTQFAYATSTQAHNTQYYGLLNSIGSYIERVFNSITSYFATTNTHYSRADAIMQNSTQPDNITILVKVNSAGNDKNFRYLGIAFNKDIGNDWWNNRNYSCNIIVSGLDEGKNITCANVDASSFAFIDAKLSDINESWNVTLYAKYGKQSMSKTCNLNLSKPCILSK